ncbi:MAG TPA: hypothetical protein VLJ39_21445 [Tepidisphaeraceae bacterium]|nr:hypothetical protein [Tepidisphaeraceae bacterium]
MSITIEMPTHELAKLKTITHCDDDAQAVLQAAREFIRLTGLRELKAASGKVELTGEWPEQEAMEIQECSLPR